MSYQVSSHPSNHICLQCTVDPLAARVQATWVAPDFGFLRVVTTSSPWKDRTRWRRALTKWELLTTVYYSCTTIWSTTANASSTDRPFCQAPEKADRWSRFSLASSRSMARVFGSCRGHRGSWWGASHAPDLNP